MKSLYGFTLMELMITVAIVAVLAAIAYPSYLDHMQKVRRMDAHTALIDLSALIEHYYTENNTYVGASITGLGRFTISQEGYYTMNISYQDAISYTLTATPVLSGPQAHDRCGALTLTNTHVQGPSIACWR